MVSLSNPDKVFWPEEKYTKGDLIGYYRDIAPLILPYLKGRPQSLHRHPDGIRKGGFFQKDMDHRVPEWFRTVRIYSEPDDRDVTYPVCDDEASLLYLVNLGCIEINPWNSRVGRLDMPDYMVFDLDPLEAPFSSVVEAAVVTREILEAAGAVSLCKTSGATGLHVYVPLGAQYAYPQVQQFAKIVNMLVNYRLPDTTSIERTPRRRYHKVYLDYLQNRRGQTMVAPYSVRPWRGAPVSAPLQWDEVNEYLDPMRFTMKTMLKRVEETGDLWEGVLGPGVDLQACLARLEKMFAGV